MITMTLTVLTFCVGALGDYVVNRRGRKSAAPKPVLTPAASPVAPKISPSDVEGFLVPEGLRYHVGHTWVEREQDHTARVGVDEFAAKLAGNIDTIELPKPGQWFLQGQSLVKLHRKGETATLLFRHRGRSRRSEPGFDKGPLAATPRCLRQRLVADSARRRCDQPVAQPLASQPGEELDGGRRQPPVRETAFSGRRARR